MPELPEVEVIRIFLEDKFLGLKIKKIKILSPKSFIGNPELVEGQKIVKFTRIGKQLSIHLSNGLILLVHLKMTGQLLFKSPLSKVLRSSEGRDLEGLKMFGHPTKNTLKNLPNKSTRLIFTFSDKSKLFFNDQRKFGWIKLLSKTELTESQKDLGLDIFNPLFTPKYIYSQFQKSSRAVKLVLLDQHYFAGIGNIYANDVLFLAKIHPQIPAQHISRSQALKLHRSLLSIMHQSILVGGSTARDQKYLRPDGTKGQNQFSFRVYQREKEPCLICQTPIKKLQLGGRGTFYCPRCQPAVVGQSL